MKRGPVLVGLILLLLAALVATWFYLNVEEVVEKTHTPPEAEALRNPYLALERFLVRMGRPLERRMDARFLDALPPGGVLVLDAGRRAQLTPERLARLLSWVERGGYLIAAAERAGDDPLLERFDVQLADPAKVFGGSVAEGADPARCAPLDRQVVVHIPGAARPLFADPPYYRGLRAGKVEPVWVAEAAGRGAQYLHFAHGAGQVTIVAGLAGQFSNTAIGRCDHAEILWTLLHTYQPQSTAPIHWMTRLEYPSLGQWLLESAWTALWSGLAFLLLWLWRVVPRFGAPLPDPEPERRQLREHLAAVGRYVWRSGGLDHWLSVGREAFLARLALRHPALAALPPVEQAEALARLTRQPVAMITDALHKPAGSVSSFTSAMRTLHHLERSL